MNRDQITRGDFPAAGSGYDRASVDAHLAAVAAWTDALRAQIAAVEVERDALRRQVSVPGRPPAEPAAEPAPAPDPAPLSDPEPPPDPGIEAGVQPPTRPEPADDEVSARLVATRLALEGSGRDEIAAKLAETYELEDPVAVADDVLQRLA